VSDPVASAAATTVREHRHVVPRRWTLHGLNNGLIFSATCRGVATLPRSVSYGIGRVGTWLAWRLMDRTREAIADNLRAVLPQATERELHMLALRTLRSYACDVIDFLKSLEASAEEARDMFRFRPHDEQLFRGLLEQKRGIILVTGHYGNWEIGSVFTRRVLDLPLTVLAMSEANADVNRIRREIRDRLQADTIEVRQSLDTALKIRRRLSENHMVAMLMDRHLGNDRVEVSMFGRRAWFLRTPAMMGYLTGAPLVPCFIERVGPGRFQVQSGEVILVARDIPRDLAISQAAQRFADQLSVRVASHPHHWYHFYPYWKAQADDYEALGSRSGN
jgi:KDO2-lipid IV(A) lauroyltransferase